MWIGDLEQFGIIFGDRMGVWVEYEGYTADNLGYQEGVRNL